MGLKLEGRVGVGRGVLISSSLRICLIALTCQAGEVPSPLLIKKVGLKRSNFSYLLFQLMTRAWVLTVTRMHFVIHFAGVFANLVTKVTEGVARVSKWKLNGSLNVSGKLPTYPSPKPTFCPK